MSELILDDLLTTIGSWGKFHFYYYVCLGFVVLFSVCPMSYIFTARDVRYRCHIPSCDSNTTLDYNPEWLKSFVPYKDKFPERCKVYDFPSSTCNASTVNRNVTHTCNKYIYEKPETTIVHDFNIHCDENLWKLTIVGTMSVLGELICLAYAGVVSDRFGRQKLLLFCIFFGMLCGILRSYSTTYLMFIGLEFVDTLVGAAAYAAAFILAMELVESRKRNIGNIIICTIFTIGEIYLGVVAMLSPSWRVILRIIYATGIIPLLFFWTMPESVRWLLTKKRKSEAKVILLKIATTNGRHDAEKAIDDFLVSKQLLKEEIEVKENVIAVLKSKKLLLRVLNCSFCWITCTFTYYGLTVQSVSLTDDVYLSFIFAVAIEIPGYIIYYFFNERLGRRIVMFFTMTIGGACCIIAGFVPEGYTWAPLIPFLIGKCCLTIAYTILYVYTTEMFPTCARHSIFSICSMFGRIGSMTAPQVPLLARLSRVLPLLLFGMLAATAGVLALLFPETLHIKLPDTIEEAVHIGAGRRRRADHTSDELTNGNCIPLNQHEI